MDFLFANDPPRIAYLKFCRHDGTESLEASISLLIKVDAVMTDSLMSFQEDLSDAYKCVDTNTPYFKDEVEKGESLSRGRKGGVVSQESVRRLRDLLLSPAANIPCYCFLTFKNQLTLQNVTEKKQHAELNALTSGATDMCMNNLKRVYIVCFQYPSVGYYYIALTTHASKELICDWIGDTHDCNTVYSRNAEKSLLPFLRETPFLPLYNSGEEFDEHPLHNNKALNCSATKSLRAPELSDSEGSECY